MGLGVSLLSICHKSLIHIHQNDVLNCRDAHTGYPAAVNGDPVSLYGVYFLLYIRPDRMAVETENLPDALNLGAGGRIFEHVTPISDLSVKFA